MVAGEIRRLASQTTAASKLTAELIEKNAKAVDTGMTAAASTAETMKESVDGARQVNSMVDKISGSVYSRLMQLPRYARALS